MAEYKESVPTLGEEINKLFFGEKGLYSLIKLDKETIDLICNRIDKDYPEYGFKDHKGYPTKSHIEAIKKYGITKFHRLSYKPVKELLVEQLTLDL